jgi:hypothetical protein
MHRCTATRSKLLVWLSKRWGCFFIYENNIWTVRCTTLCCLVVWHWRFETAWFFHIYGSPRIISLYLTCPEDGNNNLPDISVTVTKHHSATYRQERCEHNFISGCFPALEWQQHTVRSLGSSSKGKVRRNDRSTKLRWYGRVVTSSSSCSWRIRRVFCSLIHKINVS